MRNLFLVTILSLVLIIPSHAETAEKAIALKSAPQMIAVDFKLIEISKTRLRESGFDFAKVDGQEVQSLTGLEAFHEVTAAQATGLVEALVKNNLGRVLANPKITTLDGMSASLSTDPDVEVKSGAEMNLVRIGTRLDIEPMLLAGGRVQLKFRFEGRGRNSSLAGENVAGATCHYDVQTSITPRLNESTLLGGPTRKVTSNDDKPEEVVLLLIVTPELVETTADAKRSILK